MKITEDVRKYAAAQKLSQGQAIEVGLKEKAKEFAKGGSKLYAQI